MFLKSTMNDIILTVRDVRDEGLKRVVRGICSYSILFQKSTYFFAGHWYSSTLRKRGVIVGLTGFNKNIYTD